METERLHAIVQGRVQGVFFRAFTKEMADELGLVGWVRNRNDGSVETEFEGPAANTERMRQWLWSGSPQSQVTDVIIRRIEPLSSESSFTIRYDR